MRRLLGLMFLSALSLPALAADPTVIADPPVAADPPQAGARPPHHARMTWEQHFLQANLTHDGHLTLAEASGGYALIAKHFADIDTDHKGYVTE
jgi:hypothetical protein